MFDRVDVKVTAEGTKVFIEIPRDLLRQVQFLPGDTVALTVHRATKAMNVRLAEDQDQMEALSIGRAPEWK
jgi:antitoxin component of MazEF toxin-antitoxin module